MDLSIVRASIVVFRSAKKRENATFAERKATLSPRHWAQGRSGPAWGEESRRAVICGGRHHDESRRHRGFAAPGLDFCEDIVGWAFLPVLALKERKGVKSKAIPPGGCRSVRSLDEIFRNEG